MPESLVQEVNQFIESLTKRQIKTERAIVSVYDLRKQWLGCTDRHPSYHKQMKLRDIVDRIYIDPRKFTEYALNPNNPIGVDKSIMFQKYLGFIQENHQLLIQQIEASVMDAEATLGNLDQHGQRYQIDLTITGIEQRQQETVRTGWIVRPDEDFARLVTLYILRRK